jgi:hypothetical protein
MESNWIILKEFLVDRICKPFNQPGYVLYFFFIVLIVGSIGFFSELLRGLVDCSVSISNLTIHSSNIFIALIAASSVELILIKDSELTIPVRKSDIQLLGVTFLIIGFLLWILSNFLKSCLVGLILSLCGLIISYILWWISSADNKKIAPAEKANSPLGGPEEKVNDELEGDTSEFKTA